MVSLAPIKYAEILKEKGGPIGRLEYASSEVLGKPCIQAVAYLRDGLFSSRYRMATVSKQPDGAGSHESAQIACHMAISEALERWAVYHCRANLGRIECGMGVDKSSNGFAAFPGIFKLQARKLALRESIERHCLLCWWEGLLDHHPLGDPQSGVRAIGINNPFSRHEVVVLWCMRGPSHVFAFGAGDNINHAVWRALVELERTAILVEKVREFTIEHPNVPVTNTYERRLRYFSSERGFSKFLGRFESGTVGEPNPLRMLFDGDVQGPWDRYATVWRTVIEPPTRRHQSEVEDYFFW